MLLDPPMGMGHGPAKEDVARTLLLRGSLFMHFNPRHEAAELPETVRGQSTVVLQIGADWADVIPDLRVDRRNLSGTIVLDGSESAFCRIPWESVYALSGDDGRGMVWPESMPRELDQEIRREMGRLPPVGLRLVPRDDSAASESHAIERSFRERPRLHLVKA